MWLRWPWKRNDFCNKCNTQDQGKNLINLVFFCGTPTFCKDNFVPCQHYLTLLPVCWCFFVLVNSQLVLSVVSKTLMHGSVLFLSLFLSRCGPNMQSDPVHLICIENVSICYHNSIKLFTYGSHFIFHFMQTQFKLYEHLESY